MHVQQIIVATLLYTQINNDLLYSHRQVAPTNDVEIAFA